MLKTPRRKTMLSLEGNNDSKDCKCLIKNYGGQNEVEQLVTRMYKDLLQLNNNGDNPIKKEKKFEHVS